MMKTFFEKNIAILSFHKNFESEMHLIHSLYQNFLSRLENSLLSIIKSLHSNKNLSDSFHYYSHLFVQNLMLVVAFVKLLLRILMFCWARPWFFWDSLHALILIRTKRSNKFLYFLSTHLYSMALREVTNIQHPTIAKKKDFHVHILNEYAPIKNEHLST